MLKIRDEQSGTLSLVDQLCTCTTVLFQGIPRDQRRVIQYLITQKEDGDREVAHICRALARLLDSTHEAIVPILQCNGRAQTNLPIPDRMEGNKP